MLFTNDGMKIVREQIVKMRRTSLSGCLDCQHDSLDTHLGHQTAGSSKNFF